MVRADKHASTHNVFAEVGIHEHAAPTVFLEVASKGDAEGAVSNEHDKTQVIGVVDSSGDEGGPVVPDTDRIKIRLWFSCWSPGACKPLYQGLGSRTHAVLLEDGK